MTNEQTLTEDQRQRYHRHILIPDIGDEGQVRLLAARVLVVGAGGLGSPVALYLAAAGVGTLGIVDHDVVEVSNLQRQIIHSTLTLGKPKVHSASDSIGALNPDVSVVPYFEQLNERNVHRVLEGYDVAVGATDNFAARYMLNDACIDIGIPSVHASVYRFEGQVTTFVPGNGPCYRCLCPSEPEPDAWATAAQAGIIGVLPGVIGCLQAAEVIKVLLNIGEPLIGKLCIYDLLSAEFRKLSLRRDPTCVSCNRDVGTKASSSLTLAGSTKGLERQPLAYE